jgi:hypothetical protein
MAFIETTYPRSSPAPNPDDEALRLPPWVKYPNIARRSIGWQMGLGEDYWVAFRRWWGGQPEETRERVRVKYPEPAEWSGYYRMMNGDKRPAHQTDTPPPPGFPIEDGLAGAIPLYSAPRAPVAPSSEPLDLPDHEDEEVPCPRPGQSWHLRGRREELPSVWKTITLVGIGWEGLSFFLSWVRVTGRTLATRS